MHRGIVGPDVFGKHDVKLCQGMDLCEVLCVDPALFGRSPEPFYLLSECSDKRYYTTLFIIRKFL